jgi:ABC-type glycerol-3-phosphate transport system substrate-binding protein
LRGPLRARFAGPAISNGARIFDAKGDLVLDDGYKATVTKFVAWNKDGTMLKEVWAGSGGSSYADSIGEFKNARVVMVLSGSWQINRLQRTSARRSTGWPCPTLRSGRMLPAFRAAPRGWH